VASLSQGRTAAAQCGLFTHKSVPVIFEPPCTIQRCVKVQKQTETTYMGNGTKCLQVQLKIHSRRIVEPTLFTTFTHKNRIFEVALIHPSLHLGRCMWSVDIRTLLIPLKFPHNF